MYVLRIQTLTLLLLSFILLLTSCEKKEEPIIIDEDPIFEGPFDQTVETSIFSPFVNENYELKYFIPASYEDNKNLPAIYLLDGIYMFDEVLSYTKTLDFDAIIVALGNREGAERTRDYTPFGCGGSQDGYSNFYSLLTTTVIDFIDSRFEYDQNTRTLIGWSAGGMFVFQTLFTQFENEKKFSNFIAVDPAACGDNLWSPLIEKNDFTDPEKTYNLYMSRGMFFLPANLNWLVELIDTKDHPSLDVQYFEFPSLDHEEIWKPTITDGLKHIYGL